jgi:hypothetical protein
MLFADALPVPSGEQAVTLATLGSIMIGLVVWMLKSALPALIKQHRDDVFQLHKDCRDERVADQDRHERELEKRDQRFEHLMETLTDLVRGKTKPSGGQ